MWVWSRHDADIPIFHKTNHLLNSRASSLLSHMTPSIFLLSSIRFLAAEFLSNRNVLFPSPFFPPPNYLFAILSSSCSEISVNLLHLPDDLFLKDGQDGVIVTHLLEHNSAVKLVAHFLKVEPAGQKQTCWIISEPNNDAVVSLKCAIPTHIIHFQI